MRGFMFRGASVIVALIAMLTLALPARAGYDWCMSDPIVRLDGATVQILVAVPQQYVPLVDGPVAVEIATPEGTTRELLFTDAGYNGHGEVVEFEDLDAVAGRGDAFPVEVGVEVPVDESGLSDDEEVPVRVEVIVEDGAPIVAQGTSEGTDVRFRVSGR